MPSNVNRRRFLVGAGATALGMALPTLPGFAGILLPSVIAADTTTELQSNLAALAELRFGMFNHFNLGTFTDEEWAAGGQSPQLFAPTAVNTDQWAAAAAAAKMQYGVLTTKHHDGFALWPSAYGEQNVANSKYQHDVVQQYVTSMRNAGLRVGLYFSIWDRTHPVQAMGGHVNDSSQVVLEEHMDYVLGQITELMTNYGTIDMFVTDGYGWQMGQRALHYGRIRALIRQLQPKTIVIDHGGLSVPWIGDAIYFEEPLGVRSPSGNTYASLQGQTISNGWFWHPSTPSIDPMGKDDIVSHLNDLEPKYTSFILNCPPNRDGVLDTNIVNRLAEVGAAWSPNPSRPPLPEQPKRVNYRVVPTAAWATIERNGEGAVRAIDDYSDSNAETCWSTWPGTGSLAFPGQLTIDLGGLWTGVGALEYLPKQWNRSNSTDGDITDYTVSVSSDGTTWNQVAAGTWPGNTRAPKFVEWDAQPTAYVRFQANAGTGGYLNVSGLHLGGRNSPPLLTGAFPANGSTVRLVAKHSGKVIGVAGAGTVTGTGAEQQTWTGAREQIWNVTRTDDGYFKITDLNSGLTLETANKGREDNAIVDVATDFGSPSQRWSVTPVGDGYYALFNRLSGRVLNVNAASTAAGAKVSQWYYSKSDQQRFQIVAVDVPAAGTASVSNAGSDGWYAAGATLTLTSAAIGQTLVYKLGSADWAAYSAPVPLPAGSYDIQYRTVGSDGTQGAVQTLPVKVDGSVPTVTAAVNGRIVTITAADDGGSAVAQVQYRIDGGDWQSYSGPVTVDDAAHTVSYRASDKAGNQSAEGSVSVPAVVRAQIAVTSSAPANADGWYNSSVVVAVSAPSGFTVQSRQNGGAWRSGNRTYSLSSNGTQTIDTQLLQSNNVVPSSVSQTVVKIDKTPPTATAVRGQATSTGSPRNPITLTFSGSDAQSGVASVEYRVNGGAWTTAGAAAVVFDQVGNYVIGYRSTDKAGNVGAEKSTSLVIVADTATTLAASPRKAAAGTQITFTLKGFKRYDAVTLTAGTAVWGTLTTDVNGTGKLTLTIPSAQPKGATTVKAAGSDPLIAASASITVQ